MRLGRFVLWYKISKTGKTKKLSTTFLLFLILSIKFFLQAKPLSVQASGESWLTGYSYRKQITIDASKVSDADSADFTDFPVLVSLSGLSGINDNGTDIRFTSSDGKTLLAREIESYSSGILVAWVKIPTLDYNDNMVFYMYYGNTDATEPAADSTYGSQNVWDSNFREVYHFASLATIGTDSAALQNHGENTKVTVTSGLAGNAGAFDGSAYIGSFDQTLSSASNTRSICAWISTALETREGVVGTRGDDIAEGSTGFVLTVNRTHPGNLTYFHTGQGDAGILEVDGNLDNSWNYACSSISNGTAKLYVNGSQIGTKNTFVADRQSPDFNGVIGGENYASGEGYKSLFTGNIDEVRISSSARSAGWIATEYANQSDPTNFLNIGGEDEEPTSTPTPSPTPTPTSIPTSTPAPTATPTSAPASSSGTSSSSSTSTPSAPVCSDSKPAGSPDLFKIDTAKDSAILYFSPVSNTSKYYISYSTNSSAEEYGVEVNLGREGVQNYTINFLSTGTTYYFKVRGQNGCMPGNWSDVKSATTKSDFINYVTTTLETIKEELTPKKELKVISQNLTAKKSSVCSYTVSTGDSLWSIAANNLGDGYKFTDIKELNNLVSSSLSAGQELKLPCNKEEEAITQAKEEVKQEGINLNVLVKDNNNKPLEGVTVTLHSKVQTTKTDQEGIAHFTNVEPGGHKVNLAYNEYNGEQTLNVDGKNKEQTLTLQVQMNSGFSSPLVISVIGIMGGIILILFFFLFRKKAVQRTN